MYNIGIVGSRTFDDYGKLDKVILRLFPELCLLPCKHEAAIDLLSTSNRDYCIVSGGAKGADTLAESFAERNDIESIIYKADWDTYGKRAGFVRNQTIVDSINFLIAFWDGESKGTANTIKKAKEKKIATFIFYF